MFSEASALPQLHLLVIEARSSKLTITENAVQLPASSVSVTCRLKGKLSHNEKQTSPATLVKDDHLLWNWNLLLHPTKNDDVIDIRIHDQQSSGKAYIGKALLSVSQFLNRGPMDVWVNSC